MRIKTLLSMGALVMSAVGLAQSGENQPNRQPNDEKETELQGWRKISAGDSGVDGDAQADAAGPNRRAPGLIVVPAGTWIKIRVDDLVSSDRNQAGQTFTATLAQPLVMDGIVVARRGQTLEGRVTEAVKAGRVKGRSRLGVEIVEMQLADGRQVPVRTQLVEYSGGSSNGRDAGAVATATGAGAAIGAAADGGFGAGMGAIAGAGASVIGVLMTRGRATEIYPEAVVTLRLIEPVTVNTERAPNAFLPTRQEDYERTTLNRRQLQPYRPAYLPYIYDPWFYSWPGYWNGPSLGLFHGGRFGPRYYPRAGWGRRW